MKLFTVCFLALCSSALAADWTLDENPELAKYFEAEVAEIEQKHSLFHYRSLEEWQNAKPELRSQLFDSLGLQPLPERTPLQVQITGVVDEEEFRVEKLWIQSMPGLYITANFYLPKNIEQPLPTILYVCGHARVMNDDNTISFGNKTGYQHHGAWFARHGYTCLAIDTLQLGEIEGIHHGTYRHNRWWWNSRGYTPAGVEAWNCIRALDYLESRPEVDSERFGVTGRSGGGAYSWWIAALDDRIKCAVPVAGITSLRNHVVDGCVEGHCDCMYMVNTFRWDYAKVAALVAPRPLLISNTDKDRIFPLEGVVDVHRQVRHIYDLYDKEANLGLHITEGPHKDTQELRVHAFRWFNRWLKNDDTLIEKPATKFFEPQQLRVFSELPGDERNTSIDDDFAPSAPEASETRLDNILDHQAEWVAGSKQLLRSFSFQAWPEESSLNGVSSTVEKLDVTEQLSKEGLSCRRIRFQSQQHVPLSVDVICSGDETAESLTNLASIDFIVADDAQWKEYSEHCLQSTTTTPRETVANTESRLVTDILTSVRAGRCVAVFSPRGSGLHAWTGDEKKQIQIRRRFQLIGTTVDAMRVWDIRSALSVLRQRQRQAESITLTGRGPSGWLALIASIFEGGTTSCRVSDLRIDRDSVPVLLNAARHFSAVELFSLSLHESSVKFLSGDAQLDASVQKLTKDDRWTGSSKPE